MRRFTFLAHLPLVFALACAAARAIAGASHPLDGLDADEYRTVRTLLIAAGHIDNRARFDQLRLDEPPKADVLDWKPGEAFQRHAYATLRHAGALYRARVDLEAREVLEFTRIDGQQAGVLLSETSAAERILRSDPRWSEALRERGLDTLGANDIACLSFSPGYFAEPEYAERRLLRVECVVTAGTTTHVYQRPIAGLSALVDMDGKRLLRLSNRMRRPLPPLDGDYDAESVGPLKRPMKPTVTTQPEGPNFEIDGSLVRWGPWRFHLRLDRREGTVISLADYVDAGIARRVLYRGSLSEMFVPYMAPYDSWYYKTFFDAGDFGFGLMATPLNRGIDCPEHATLHGGTLAFDRANPVEYAGSICLFERPLMRPAWRHYESVNNTFEGRPAVELVVRMIAAVGNYDYMLDWVFMPTGAIRVDIASTGIDAIEAVSTQHMDAPEAREDTRYGTLISASRVGINHDHFFSLRLDVDVDGPRNSFVADRLVTERLPATNPRRSLWRVEPRVARTERDAMLDIDLAAPALWRVRSETRRNRFGNPTGYVLVPGRNARSLLTPDDWPQRRAAFTNHHLWVTPYAARELFAAGEFTNQSRGDTGLAAWTQADRDIADTDLVLWYTLGFHHVTAAEDWPVLPMHTVSVTLKPHNFFDRNPLIDAAKP